VGTLLSEKEVTVSFHAPGWDSVAVTSTYARWFTYAGFAALFLLGVFEILGHIYSVHETTLTAVATSHDADNKRAEADARIAEAQRGAAEASAKAESFRLDIANAEQRASEAAAKSERFRLDIAQANERASTNEREAAELKKLAEDEKLARVKIEESVAWRAPDRELIQQLAPPLQAFAEQRFTVIFEQSEPERFNVLSWLLILLSESKWKFETATSQSELKLPSTNIVVWVTPTASDRALKAAQALVPALTRAGLAPTLFQSGWGPPPEASPADLIRVVIFKKGPPVVFQPSPR
jgi:hypothetical protein